MKIKIAREEFVAALTSVAKATVTGSQLQILSSVVLDTSEYTNTIIIAATNLEVEIKLAVMCEVLESGIAAIPAAMLVALVSNAPAKTTITLETDGNYNAMVSYDKFKSNIKCLDAENYPRFDRGLDDNATTIALPVTKLVDAIKHVGWGAGTESTSEGSPAMLMDFQGSWVTLVTYNMTLATCKIELEQAVNALQISPAAKSMVMLANLLAGKAGTVELTINSQQKQIVFSTEGFTFSSSVLETRFLNYQKTFDNFAETANAQVDTSKLLTQTRTANIFAQDERNKACDMELNGGNLRLFINTETGSCDVDIPTITAGGEAQVVFNVDLFNQMLSQVKSSQFDLRIGPKALQVVEPSSGYTAVMAYMVRR